MYLSISLMAECVPEIPVWVKACRGVSLSDKLQPVYSASAVGPEAVGLPISQTDSDFHHLKLISFFFFSLVNSESC